MSDAIHSATRFFKEGKWSPNHQGNLFWALQDVTFEVQRGEVIGIMGRNGAGKSTLLKILSRIVEPTRGIARLRGRVASLLEVGTGFHPELTGRENIYLNGAMLGMRKAEINRKLDEIIAFSEIEKFLDTPVKRYSSGMYVRLAFAVAANLEPEILIVDEVLAVGDYAFQKKCMGKMSDVASGRGTNDPVCQSQHGCAGPALRARHSARGGKSHDDRARRSRDQELLEIRTKSQYGPGPLSPSIRPSLTSFSRRKSSTATAARGRTSVVTSQ